MAQGLPPLEDELPEAPPIQSNPRMTPPPPIENLPDPTMMTNRPERPMPEGYRQWKEAEESLRPIQGQRPRLEDNKPSIWNRLAGGIAGGLGGYLASSPSAVSRGNASMAFDLAPKLLRPGYQEKMQSWDQDLKAATDRAKRSQEGLKIESDIEESRSNQDYKQAAADYQRQLPDLQREKAKASTITITPESVKELNLPDDMVGVEVPASFWKTFVQERSYAAKSKADMERKQAELEAQMERLREMRDSVEQEGERTRKSRESIAAGSNKTKLAAAGISANKKKGARTTQAIKDGDQYFMGILDPDTKQVSFARDEEGNRIEVAPPRKDDDFNPFATPTEPPKPPAAVKPTESSASRVTRTKIVRDAKGKLVKETPNAKNR